jgi:hypothetical protein
MSLFPETIRTALAGGKVQCANLVMFDFASEPMRLWTGGYKLDTNDGAVWRNVGTLGNMSGIEQAVNGEAPQAIFTLSGVSTEIMHIARDEFASEAKGRMARVYIQFFGVDDPEDPNNQRVLDLPYPVWGGRMLQPSFNIVAGEDGEPAECTVTISAESIFSLRSRPRWAMYTDSDQRNRFPEANDRGFEFVGNLVNKVTTWPDY